MKIISGGQTGADRTALELAVELGFPTGGFAPKGYLTELGPDLSLRDLYHLEEHISAKYPPRTYENVKLADLTVWFGRTSSAGFTCTMKAIAQYQKPNLVNPSVEEFLEFYDKRKPEIINIAGNRLSGNHGIVHVVSRVLRPVLLALQHEEQAKQELYANIRLPI